MFLLWCVEEALILQIYQYIKKMICVHLLYAALKSEFIVADFLEFMMQQCNKYRCKME